MITEMDVLTLNIMSILGRRRVGHEIFSEGIELPHRVGIRNILLASE